jgi:hypothetical protein
MNAKTRLNVLPATTYASVADHSPMPAIHLEWLDAGAAQRSAAEAFVAEVFRQSYDAYVQHFLPRFLTLRGADHDLRAVLGMRHADNTALFLEAYLSSTIEQHISEASGIEVPRSSIVELGNLASTHRGALRCIIVALTAYLKNTGPKWVAFTGTPTVLNAFRRLGLPLYALAAADKRRLGAAAGQWGRYYDSSPLVVACSVEEAYDALQQALTNERDLLLACMLWGTALGAGYLGCQRLASRAP